MGLCESFGSVLAINFLKPFEISVLLFQFTPPLLFSCVFIIHEFLKDNLTKMLTEEQCAKCYPKMLLSWDAGALGCHHLVSPKSTKLNHQLARISHHA